MKNRKKNIFFVTVVVLLFALGTPILLSMFYNKTAISDGKIIINKEINAPYLSSVKEDVIVLFFGYVGCAKVCTPILQNLNSLYESKEMEKLKKSTRFVFVNLIPELPTDQSQIFASSFNKEFVGIHLDKRELFDIEREFALFYSAGVTSSDEMTHSDSVYLIKRERGKLILKNIYSTHPLRSKNLISDIGSILR